MNNNTDHRQSLIENGYSIVENIYTACEVTAILQAIDTSESVHEVFRKSDEVFAIRQFLKEVPHVCDLVFTEHFKQTINQVLGSGYFVIKSLYFNKPVSSNWFVAYHQDLTISVNKKAELEGYGPWTDKTNYFSVRPPISVLENITTVRIHLDDTTDMNGALRIIPKSHLNKIYRPDSMDIAHTHEIVCEVKAGGIMFMKPLLLHSSSRTTNNKPRRVIHIELSSVELPAQLEWAERLNLG